MEIHVWAAALNCLQGLPFWQAGRVRPRASSDIGNRTEYWVPRSVNKAVLFCRLTRVGAG